MSEEVPSNLEFPMSLITSSSSMSNSGWHRGGQPTWWLRGVDGFVDVPKIRGDKAFSADLDLPVGTYTLGVGRGKDEVRETIIVRTPEDQAAHEAAVKAAQLAKARALVERAEAKLTDVQRIYGARAQAGEAGAEREVREARAHVDWTRAQIAKLESA